MRNSRQHLRFLYEAMSFHERGSNFIFEITSYQRLNGKTGVPLLTTNGLHISMKIIKVRTLNEVQSQIRNKL